MEPTDIASPSVPVSGKIPLLPLWATVKKAYSTAWGYRMEYWKIVWCWVLVALPIMCLYTWFVWPSVEPVMCVNYAHLPDKATRDANTYRFIIAASIPEALFKILMCASIAVAWHRLILRHEKIANAPYLRLDSVVWDYFAFGLCFYLLSISATLTSLIFDSHQPLLMLIKALSMFVLLIFAILISVRLSIIMPARALKIKDVTLGAVWQKTSWNFWRLLWGNFLCILPGVPLYFIARMGCGSAIAGPIIYGTYLLVSIIICTPFMLAFLSLSYQHFFERSDGATT